MKTTSKKMKKLRRPKKKKHNSKLTFCITNCRFAHTHWDFPSVNEATSAGLEGLNVVATKNACLQVELV